MRSFKKALTMALVFVMAIGLLSAGALDFTDAADVQYAEAVEVMTNIGAINGFPDGTFQPDGLLTRAQAAKLVAYAILTPRVAEYLPSGTSSFTDVPANHWAAPYIEYCVTQGIVNGRGNGIFDPNGNVTGIELAKMMLVAAGYGQNDEYVGASWSLNVTIDAIDNDIFSGSKAENYAAPATREEAALYVFNALTNVDMVNYSKDKEAYELTVTDGQNIGEQKYGLTQDKTPMNGVNGHVWKNRLGVAVSSFIVTENVLGTSVNGTAISKLTDRYDSAYIASLDNAVSFTYNGFEEDVAYAKETAYAKDSFIVNDNKLYVVKTAIAVGNTDEFSALVTAKTVELFAPAKGVIVNFVDANYNGKADKIAITEKQVAKLTADPVVKNDTVKITGIIDTATGVKNVPGYETLAKDDIVLWYKDAAGVYNIEKAESVAGTITAKAGNKYYIDGVAYELTELEGINDTPALGDQGATYYLDNGGFIAYITDAIPTFVPDTYALVLDYNYDSDWAGTDASSQAKLLLQDGTEGIFNLVTKNGKVQDDDLKTTPGKGGLIKYEMNDDGVITKVTPIIESKTGGTVTNKSAKATFGTTPSTFYVSSKTVFFFYGSGADDYGVAVGFANVPTTTTSESIYFAADDKDVLKAVVIPENYEGLDSPEVYAYISDGTPVETFEIVNGTRTRVYTYNVFMNGEATTVKSLTNKYSSAELEIGIHVAQESDGYYELTPVILDSAGKKVTIAESTYFVDEDAKLYSITRDTEIYQATWMELAPGISIIVNLEADDLKLEFGKDLMVDVVASGDNAAYVIFWYK